MNFRLRQKELLSSNKLLELPSFCGYDKNEILLVFSTWNEFAAKTEKENVLEKFFKWE